MNDIPIAEAVDQPSSAAPENKSQLPLIEQLLSPKTLQRMMASGGVVLVLGFIGWLWSIGLFDEPIVVAFMIGAGTLGTMGIGMAMVRFTRYQLAGNGLTLLAALAMPLNLWFYSAQGLITLEGGGHLWIPAAICCAIYAFVARVLRNSMFVYALVSGVVMTGLLFLADQAVGHFWELLSPATLLVSVGWICVHCESLFPKEEGDFSRNSFGKAFYRSGMVALAGGLGIVFAGHMAAFLNGAISFVQVPLLATNVSQKLWATALIAASALGFGSQSIFHRRQGFLVGSLALSAWASIAFLDAMAFQPKLPHVAITLGLFVAANLIRTIVQQRRENASREQAKALDWGFACIGLTIMAFAQFGYLQLGGSGNLIMSPASWIVVVQFFVAAAACALSWYSGVLKVQHIKGLDGIAVVPSSMSLCWSCITGVVAVVSSLQLGGVELLDVTAAISMLIPTAALGFAIRYKDHPTRSCFVAATTTSLTFLLFCLGLIAIPSTPTLVSPHLSWCWMFAAASVLYFVASQQAHSSIAHVLGFISACIAVTQGLVFAGCSADYAFVLTPSVLGVGLSLANFLFRSAANSRRNEVAANVLVTSGSVLGLLMSAGRVATQDTSLGLLGLIASQLVFVAIAGLLTQQRAWRVSFRAIAIANVLVSLAVFNDFMDTHWLHRIELGAVMFGVALLVMGHIGWYREGDTKDEAATVGLWLGSLLVALPLSAGLFFYRSYQVQSDWNWMLFHEVATIVFALGMLGAGMACRIRSTTIGGTGMLTAYVGSVLLLVQWPSQLHSVSVVMMIGGGVFFGTAVLLSIYRDRLVSLQHDMKAGKGMFRVLRWR